MALFVFFLFSILTSIILVLIRWFVYLRRYDLAVDIVNVFVRHGKRCINKRVTTEYDVLILANHFCDVATKLKNNSNQITQCGSLIISSFEERYSLALGRLKNYFKRVASGMVTIVVVFVTYVVVHKIGEAQEFWSGGIYDEWTSVVCGLVAASTLVACILSQPEFKTRKDDEEIAYQMWLITISLQLSSGLEPAKVLAESYDFVPASIRTRITELVQKIKANPYIVEPYSFVMNELKNDDFSESSYVDILVLKAVEILSVAPYFLLFFKLMVDVVNVIKTY